MVQREHDVLAIGEQVTAIYEPVVDGLQEVRVCAAAFEAGVAEFDASETETASDAGASLTHNTIQAFVDLRDTIVSALGVIGTPEAAQSLRQLVSYCADLKNNSRELNALSSMMLVTAANTHDRIAVEDLVSELRSLSVDLNAEGAGITDVVVQVRTSLDASSKSLNKASDVVGRQISDTQSSPEAEHFAESDTSQTDRALRAMASSLSQSVSEAMPGIVACMQHPDAFAQRCAHIADILDKRHDDATDPAAHATLAALAAAQIDDMRAELDQVQVETCAALDEIARACDDTIEAFRDNLNSDTRVKMMSVQQEKVQQTREAIEMIKSDTDAALADLESCQSVIRDMSAAFARLDDMREAVALSSLNADLSERKAKTNAPEMRAVTKAIGASAQSCGATISSLEAAFAVIEQVLSGNDREKISSNLLKTCNFLDEASMQFETIAGQVKSFLEAQRSCSETLETLVVNARSAESRIASNSLALQMLDQMHGALKAEADAVTFTAGDLDPDLSRQIFEAYTIASERQVHASLLGIPDGASISDPSAAEDEDWAFSEEDAEDDPLASVLF